MGETANTQQNIFRFWGQKVLKCLTLSLWLSLFTAATGQAQVCQDGGPSFPRIALVYGSNINPSSTPAELASLARYELLVGYGYGDRWSLDSRRVLSEKIQALRNAREGRTTILHFELSAPYMPPARELPNFPAHGYLVNTSGERIAGWPGTYMLNLSQPDVVAHMATYPRETLASNFGLDGVFYDCLGPGFDLWACNIASGAQCNADANRDGQADSLASLNATWKTAKVELARQTRANIGPNAVFMANQADHAAAPYLNGILLEDYLDYVLDNGLDWEKTFEEYQYWVTHSMQPSVTTFVSSSGIDVPLDIFNRSQSEKDAVLTAGRAKRDRMRFGLATTLQSDGYFGYDLSTNWRGQQWWYDEYEVPLGCPQSETQKLANGLWKREFEGGSVLVNPTYYDQEITLPSGRRTVQTTVQVCPVVTSKDYKQTCTKQKKKKIFARCSEAYEKKKAQTKRRGKRWKGAAQKNAADKRTQCRAAASVRITKTCTCHDEPRTAETNYIWRDVSSLESNERFIVPFLDGRLFTKTGDGPQAPQRELLEQPIFQTAPTSPTVTTRNDSVIVRSPSNLDLRVQKTGEISSFLVDGQRLISSIKPTFIRHSDWKPFGLITGNATLTANQATFLSSTTAVDATRIDQSLVATVSENRINLDFSFLANTTIPLHVNRLQLCLNVALIRGSTLQSDVGNATVAMNTPTQGFYLAQARRVQVGPMDIQFSSPVSVYDGRPWGSDCVNIVIEGPPNLSATVPWTPSFSVQKR